jgi:hypothetical protein
VMVGDKPAMARNAGSVDAAPQTLGSTVGHLHVGSNRPHAVDGAPREQCSSAPSGRNDE